MIEMTTFRGYQKRINKEIRELQDFRGEPIQYDPGDINGGMEISMLQQILKLFLKQIT